MTAGTPRSGRGTARGNQLHDWAGWADSLSQRLPISTPLRWVLTQLLVDIAFSQNPWICPPGGSPRARLRLFCVPHAGGGASLFRHWQSGLPEDLEVCGIQLPGRENRSRETPLSDLASIVRGLGQALHPIALSGPFVLFGHSMGALIAFELVRWLQEHRRIRPVHLIVSGCNALGAKTTSADGTLPPRCCAASRD
jgi:pimeloyl-ACP methyl ester carboxylesterase